MIRIRPGVSGSFLLSGVAVALIGLLACQGPSRSGEGSTSGGEGTNSPRFEDVTAASGIAYSGSSFGAAWGDLNGDGFADVWVGHHQGSPALYLNQRDGTFRDVAAEIGVAAKGDAHGAAWGDFDNDGDQDLFESVGGLRNRMAETQRARFSNRLYVNQGGRLADEARLRGVDHPTGRGRHGLWVDWNRDGQLDLVLVNDVAERGPTVLLFERAGERFVELEPPALAGGLEKASLFATLADLTGEGPAELVVHGFGFPQAVFTLAAGRPAEIRDSLGLPRLSLTFDATFGDFDGDARADLFAARTRPPGSEASLESPHLLRAQFHGRVGAESGVSFVAEGEIRLRLGPEWQLGVSPEKVFVGAAGSHPAALELDLGAGDARWQGIAVHQPGQEPGVFIGYSPAARRWTILHSKTSDVEFETVTVEVTSRGRLSSLETIGFRQPSDLASTLALRRAGAFEDATTGSGLESIRDCVSVAAADFDNDMDLDLYLVCTRRLENLPNRLFVNRGDGVFDEAANGGGAAGSRLGRGDAVAVADFDNDGFLDLFVTNGVGTPPFNVGPDQLLRNLGNGNHWLAVELLGTRSNRDGVGARVTVTTADGVRQVRIAGARARRVVQDQSRIHFGLGRNHRAARLAVEWPSGALQEETDVAADRIVELVEPASGADEL